MPWWKSISSGVAAALGATRLSVSLYLLTLVFGVVIVWPVRSFLLQHSGQSRSLDSLVERTGYTFLNDFRVAYGDGWLPDFGQLAILTVLYLLIWTFLTGGIIQRLRVERPSTPFLTACGTHFRTLLAINGVFLFVQSLLVVLFFLLYRSVSSGFSTAELDTEVVIFTSLPWVGGTYVLLASWILIWQGLSHIAHVRDDRNAWQAIGRGIYLFRKRFGAYVCFGVLSLAILVILYLLFHALKQAIPVGEMLGGLWVLLLLTQAWLWARIFLKLCFTAILLRLCRRNKLSTKS